MRDVGRVETEGDRLSRWRNYFEGDRHHPLRRVRPTAYAPNALIASVAAHRIRMLPQQMGPASHRRFRLGGWQNDCSENRRSDGVRVASAGDVRPGGLGPGSFSLAWRPAIDAARYRGAGKACSRLQAAEGSCRQAHAAARSQHRARASAARLARPPYSMSGGGGGSVEALQAATIADAAMDRKKRARALQGHERACTSPTRQDAAHAQTGEIPAWSRVGRFALVYARRTVT